VVQYGLIGYPLGHSFSKQYFTQKFAQLGLTQHSYHNFELQNINALTQVLQQHPNLKGFNITIPHKQTVLPFLHNTSNLPNNLLACNCVHIVNGQLIGYNTDVLGFTQSLQPLLQPQHTNALVLGNGGAALAVKAALQQLQINYQVVGRTAAQGINLLYQQITAEVMAQHTLIINTTPLGTHPNTQSYPPIPYQYLTAQHLLYDLVYNPAQTQFLQKGLANNATIKNGADMLVLQAEASWKIWNGLPV
jgi:shikimate dehydrogenase